MELVLGTKKGENACILNTRPNLNFKKNDGISRMTYFRVNYVWRKKTELSGYTTSLMELSNHHLKFTGAENIERVDKLLCLRVRRTETECKWFS